MPAADRRLQGTRVADEGNSDFVTPANVGVSTEPGDSAQHTVRFFVKLFGESVTIVTDGSLVGAQYFTE